MERGLLFVPRNEIVIHEFQIKSYSPTAIETNKFYFLFPKQERDREWDRDGDGDRGSLRDCRDRNTFLAGDFFFRFFFKIFLFLFGLFLGGERASAASKSTYFDTLNLKFEGWFERLSGFRVICTYDFFEAFFFFLFGLDDRLLLNVFFAYRLKCIQIDEEIDR